MEVISMTVKRVALCVVTLVLVSLAGAAFGAENVYLFLKANGNDIQGGSTVSSMGRENAIECFAYEFDLTNPAGRDRTKRPTIVISKQIDKATPLLAQVLAENEVVEGEFRFYRPNPAGDGTTEQFFTVKISKGRITSIRYVLPDTMDQATASLPAYEEVTFAFGSFVLDYGGQVTFETSVVPGDATGEDNAAPEAGADQPAATPRRPKLRLPDKPAGDGQG
jgi:type VI secretion system secreted protein Hcp